MNEESPRPSRFEQSRHPVAIVHEGFFVYANPALLQRLGYHSVEDLQAIPLLDLVEDRDHERLREHLDAAKQAAGTDRHPPETRLAFRKSDDLPLPAECVSFRTRYGGEDCVQINLRTRTDDSLNTRIRSLPWRHYLSLVFLALFTILPSSLLLQLNIDGAPTVYFPDDEPAVRLDQELRERFPDDQVFVLLFEGVALYSDGFLSAYDDLGRELRRLEAIDDVLSVTLQDHIAGTADGFIVEPLIDVGSLSEVRPGQRLQRVLDDRFSRNALAAADGSALAMIVIPQDTGNSFERLALEEAILAAVTTARLDGYLKAVAGEIPVDVAQLRSMLRDNMIFIPATVVTGLALIWWLFRRWLAVMLAGIAIGVVVNSTVAFYVLFDQPFTLLSSIIPPLLSALTVAALIHLFNGLYLGSQRGLGGQGRVSSALAEVNRPALFAALTTAAGLASLATSPIVPIKVFGLISAAGTLLIYLVVFRVLPNIITRWDKSGWPRVRGGVHLVDRAVAALCATGLRHPLAVILAVAIGLALGAPQLTKVVVETNLQEFFEPDHRIRRDTRHIDAKMVGTMPLAVIFNSPQPGGLKDPAALQQIRSFQDWAEQQPEIDRSIGQTDFIEEMHWGFHAEDPAYRRLPDDPRLVSQYLLVYDGDDLYDFVDRDLQHSQVALNLNVHSANAISALLERIRAYLEEHVGDTLEWEVAGVGRLFADMENLLVAGQVYSLWGALVLIFVCMLFLLRSVAGAALCMIPNLSPVFLIFAIMGVSGIWLDMATAMIASVAIGIAVDDTIHVYHGFQQRLQRGLSPVRALVRTYRSAGRAVVVTTLILSSQFLILTTSDFIPTRNFGLLTTLGLVAALVFDLLLLPAILIVVHGRNSPLAAWLARRRDPPGGATVAPAQAADRTLNHAYWTIERKVALVREILAGRTTVAAAAREYDLPESAVDSWVDTAEQGMINAFISYSDYSARDPEKLRALAKAYRRLEAENQRLKSHRADDAEGPSAVRR